MGVSLAALPELGKLRWRCRRGMQELDILLARYVDERFPSASKCEQDAFQRLLETHDTVIYAYCLGQVKPPDDVAALIERITAGPAAGSQ
ncbi:MAG TPA: succinate dehydrogenase assembly factor 2 [Steroidobacteraceae bacterium]|jgi:antitoxin CptB|nr:succinate dehydrogenase assembly factor 2 [Steroidobacteraceae bacterium]